MYAMTEPEKQLVLDLIYLNMAHKVLTLDLAHIDKTCFKFKEVYFDLIQTALHQVSQDRSKVKKRMKAMNIHLYKEMRCPNTVVYEINSRGYHHQLEFTLDVLRNSTKDYIYKYLTQIHT